VSRIDDLIADYEQSFHYPVRRGLGQTPQVTEDEVKLFYRRLTGKEVFTFGTRHKGKKGYNVIIGGDTFPRKTCRILLVPRWWERKHDRR
jgi:hypothetical protein